jgi:hypothetical protein
LYERERGGRRKKETEEKSKRRTFVLDRPVNLNRLEVLNARVVPQDPSSKLLEHRRHVSDTRSTSDENNLVVAAKVVVDAVRTVEEDGCRRVRGGGELEETGTETTSGVDTEDEDEFVGGGLRGRDRMSQR